MCERLVAPFLVMLVCLAAPLRGQSADELRVRLERIRAASLRADSAWLRERSRMRAVRTARVVAGGRAIAYEPGPLTAGDSARLAEGLVLGRAR
ncbi:MAG: hypothetical protein OEW77_11790, partial [Gemmatimonadota bacterium]|nr:hypothetical protein [Gemmatimonadota bacterium]